MPIRGFAKREEFKRVRLHQDLIDAMKKVGNATELANYDLALKYAPELLAKFDQFKKTPRYSKKSSEE